jgi:hypothetical protein
LKKTETKVLKKLQKNICETKKSSTFAPARNTLTSVNQELETEINSVKKQEEYVPRHIDSRFRGQNKE